MANKPNNGLLVDFSSKAPDHILKLVKEHCLATGTKMQHFIASAIEEKLEKIDTQKRDERRRFAKELSG